MYGMTCDKHHSVNTVSPPLFIILATEIRCPAAYLLNTDLACNLGKRLELETLSEDVAREERVVDKFCLSGCAGDRAAGSLGGGKS